MSLSKEGFLAHRELYSYQLKNYLEDNLLQQNSTCMIYFSENKSKLEKEATKILNKYKKSRNMTVTRIEADKFRFTKTGRIIIELLIWIRDVVCISYFFIFVLCNKLKTNEKD